MTSANPCRRAPSRRRHPGWPDRVRRDAASRPDVWGRSGNPGTAVVVLREAVALGVNFFDTASAYGPRTVNQLIAEALHSSPRG
jgi:hypothetical protein